MRLSLSKQSFVKELMQQTVSLMPLLRIGCKVELRSLRSLLLPWVLIKGQAPQGISDVIAWLAHLVVGYRTG